VYYALVIVADKWEPKSNGVEFATLECAKIVGADSGHDYGVIECNGLVSRVVFDTRYKVKA